jgi:two-component system sensor histidine kinase and response regulator WspE
MSSHDLSQHSMLDLFRLEAESQVQVLTSGLLALERDPAAADQLEACMRAAHSLKGAARIVDLPVAVRVAHGMEDCFVAAQEGRVVLARAGIDVLLKATDLIGRMAGLGDVSAAANPAQDEVERCLAELARVLEGGGRHPAAKGDARRDAAPSMPPAQPSPDPRMQATPAPAVAAPDNPERVLRVTADHLNALLGLTAESLVGARWIKSFSASLGRLKRMHNECADLLDGLHQAIPPEARDEHSAAAFSRVRSAVLECHHFLSERLVDLETFDSRTLNLSHRMHDEAVACRMRPFADGVQPFPRLVRDLAHSLGKQARLEIVGESTQVDRDILTTLDAPLGHLLRNAIDHGIESPEERRAGGKSVEGTIRLEARHSAGTLQVIVEDDGRGVDVQKMRATVIARNLITREAAERLSEAELLEFLFLPGFSTKGTVTDISGRGVGLDVVRDMVKRLRGTVRVSSQVGQGTRFLLQLPVTLSVVRTLLAEVGGEPYAFPLGSILRTLRIPKEDIHLLEGRQHFDFDGQRIGLLPAHQVLGVGDPAPMGETLSVIVLGDHGGTYGVVVDRFLGERELVVQPLDSQLGKVKDIAAGALMEDGSPVLIVDPEDLLRSMDRLVSAGRPDRVGSSMLAGHEQTRKRVLIVDDSLTVRELERKLLGNRGYEVEVAVDGMDGWNALRAGQFDLVVTDIDMPRMDGIELVSLITSDPNLKSVPVVVVSYKDREQDRRRGLEAGAAYYLTKGSFHDETLLQVVVDLIGEAQS